MGNTALANRYRVALGLAKPTMPTGRPVGDPKSHSFSNAHRKGIRADYYLGNWPNKWPCTENHSHDNIYEVPQNGELRCRVCERERKRKERAESVHTV